MEEHAASGSTRLAPWKVNTCLKANTVFEYKVRAKECPPPRSPNPSSPFKDGGGDPAPCVGQMRVMADAGLNRQLKMNRLDNCYMLLVPINLIALPPHFYKAGKHRAQFPVGGSRVHPLCCRCHQVTGLTQVIPSDPGAAPCQAGAPRAGPLKSSLDVLLVVRFMRAYARITVMPWYLFENERIIWSL